MGVGALGFVQRGFDTVVLPAMGQPLASTGCISCGQCVSVCPTGALMEHLPMSKQIPLQTEKTNTICGFCSMGCAQITETCGSLAVKAVPDGEGPVNAGVLCKGGKFGFSSACKEENRIVDPLIGGTESTYHDALMLTAKKIEAIARRASSEAVAVAVSDRFTNEEAYAAKKLADALGAKVFSFNNRACGLEAVLGLNASPNTIDEVLSTEVVLAVGFDASANAVMRVKLMQAAKSGAKVVLINPAGYEQAHMSFVTKAVYTENNLNFLKQMAKALVDSGRKDIDGWDDFAASLAEVAVSEDAAEIAALYAGAKKAMIVFQQNVVSAAAAVWIADLAVLSGHIGSPRDGILMLKSKNNSQGLQQLGITAGPECLEGVQGLLVFGENPPTELLKDREFVMVSDTHLSSAAQEADVILPGSAPIHASGSYLNTERRFQVTEAALEADVVFNNWQLICELAETLEISLPYDEEEDIQREMMTELAWYREASEGDVIGGVLTPAKRMLVAAADAALMDPAANTDYLKDLI